MKLRNFAKIFDNNIDRAFKTYFMILLAEIIVLFVSTISGQADSLNTWDIVAMNGILSIPISLIVLLTNGKSISINTMIVRSILLSVITSIALYGAEGKETSIIAVVILSMGTILFTMFNSNISIRRFSNELLITLISLLIVFVYVSIIIFTNSVLVRDIVAIELAFSVIFFLLFEILCRKWQNSLMR